MIFPITLVSGQTVGVGIAIAVELGVDLRLARRAARRFSTAASTPHYFCPARDRQLLLPFRCPRDRGSRRSRDWCGWSPSWECPRSLSGPISLSSLRQLL